MWWNNSTGTIGAGKKNIIKGKGLLLGKNSPFNKIPLVGAILETKHCPIMTSTGLSLFSKDQIINKHNTGYYVIDLDDSLGSGTHWVVMNIKRDIIEYFNSFGLNCLEEVIRVSNRLNLYNSTEYQDLLSVLCGYYCLHCMNECSWRATENLHNEKLSCHTRACQVALQIFWVTRRSSRFVWFELVMNDDLFDCGVHNSTTKGQVMVNCNMMSKMKYIWKPKTLQ